MAKSLNTKTNPPEESSELSDLDSYHRKVIAVVHDCNNLLMGIYGNSDYLVEGLSKDDPNLEVAEEIRQAAEEALDAIGKLQPKRR